MISKVCNRPHCNTFSFDNWTLCDFVCAHLMPRSSQKRLAIIEQIQKLHTILDELISLGSRIHWTFCQKNEHLNDLHTFQRQTRNWGTRGGSFKKENNFPTLQRDNIQFDNTFSNAIRIITSLFICRILYANSSFGNLQANNKFWVVQSAWLSIEYSHNQLEQLRDYLRVPVCSHG